MKFFRGFLARAGLALATVLPIRPTPAAASPITPAPAEDPASYFHLEIHVGAHTTAVRPVTREELAAAWTAAEAHWAAHYRDLAQELAAVTRARGRA